MVALLASRSTLGDLFMASAPRFRFMICLLAMLLFTVGVGSSAFGQDPPKDDNPGLKYLDEATDLRLQKLETPEELTKLITAAEKALELGLDESNTELAKDMIASAAFQKAQLTYASVVQARNPSSLLRLRKSLVADLNKAIANNPKLAEAYILLALVEEGAKAGEVLGKAIELLKDDPAKQASAYVMRGSKLGTAEERLRDFKKAVEIDPSNKEAWQLLIAIEMQLGKLEEALADSRSMLSKEPENPFAIKATYETLLALDRKQEALDLLNEKIEILPESAEFRVQRAELLADADRPEDAIKDLDKAIELDPRNAQALLKRCQLRLASGDFDKAEQDVEDVLILAPNQPLALYFRSLIAANQQRMGDAIADMQQVVQLAPDSVDFRYQLGTLYQVDNRPKKAIQIADEILKSTKENWKAYQARALRMRGDARLSLGEHKDAIKDFEQGLQLIGDVSASSDSDEGEGNPETSKKAQRSGFLNNLAWVLATSPVDELRDGARSIKLGLEACALTEYKESHILSTLAAGYAENGQFDEAVTWAEKAVEAGKKQSSQQLDQLQKELESYQEKKPWREKQETKDKKAPIVPSSGGVDT